jgi:diguanylate cyclase (GGDEF)-like protein
VSETVLIADDDSDIVRFVQVNLKAEGFDVLTASNGEDALNLVFDNRPDLVLLDVMMPKLDGYEVCRRLRADSRTSHVSIIMLTAKALSADKVVGLTAGADDYIIKPFDPMELVARVKTTLRRSREMRAISPLTGLPGNLQIAEEVHRRVSAGETLAVCYADLNNFKAYNDHYGFLRGDEAIRYTADVLRRAVDRSTGEGFLGHIGGDDFLAVLKPDDAEAFCKTAVELFDGDVAGLYDPKDAEAGFIEVEDRKGAPVKYGVLTLSIGVSTNRYRPVDDHRKLIEVATEMKSFAKQQRGSVYAIDRRGAGEDER